jgi:alkylated DNA repair protein (DNA oxidative demethylase)
VGAATGKRFFLQAFRAVSGRTRRRWESQTSSGDAMNASGSLFSPPLAPQNLPEGVHYRPLAVQNPELGAFLAALKGVLEAVPPVQTRVKGGGMTSAAMTNCGKVGWWSDKTGYRYIPTDPATGRPWPPIPEAFQRVVRRLAVESPWPDFVPDACIINVYATGAKMGLHQDRDEKDFSQPIITVSLGDDGDFLIGGFARADKAVPLILHSGDALIMGGASRMRFHGIRKIYPGTSPLPDIQGRYSLTFRKAL